MRRNKMPILRIHNNWYCCLSLVNLDKNENVERQRKHFNSGAQPGIFHEQLLQPGEEGMASRILEPMLLLREKSS